MPKENVIIERNTEKDEEPQKIQSLLQKGKPLNLSEEQQNQAIKEIKAEFDVMKTERKDIDGMDFDTFLDMMDRQKKGNMPKTAGRAYNLDTGLSQIKCSDIIGTAVEAILGVEPIVSITPRPGFAKGDGYVIAGQQQEFIDYAIDEKIPLEDPLTLAADSAVYKRVGIIKWIHKVRKEPRIRTEKYTGKKELVSRDQSGQPIFKNQGIEDFMLQYGEDVAADPKKYEWILKGLDREEVVKFDVQYDEIVYNDPFPRFVDNKNFYTRRSTNGYEGLCEAQLTVERHNYSYFKLKELEKENSFVNINKVIHDTASDGKLEEKPREGYATENYNVLECVFRFTINGEVTKTVMWVYEDKMVYLGGIYFPFTVIECYYVPHYVKITGVGFYQEGVAETLTDTHLAKNAILNHTLESAQMATTMVPIVPVGSDMANQILNNTWINGMPLYGKKGEFDFLNKYMTPPDVGGLLALDGTLSRIGDQISRVSDLRSGKETPLDPKAPARKTAMLLQESGRGVKGYVDIFSRGFDVDVMLILRIYYEMNDDEQEYLERRQKQVTGAEPKKITKNALMAKTMIQSQAMAYDFNKMDAKRQDLLNNQFLTNESLIMNNPQANWERLNILISSMDPKWRNNKEKLLPSLEDFNQQMAQIAVQAVQQFIQQMVEQAQITGQPPQMDPQALIELINKLQSMATRPIDQVQEIQKEEAKQN